MPGDRGPRAAGTGAQLSIDTSKVAVARAALDAGATYVNDVTAFRAAIRRSPALVAERGVECCLMHMLGEPRTMQEDPRYDDVVVRREGVPRRAAGLRGRARACPRSGCARPGHRLRQDARAQPRAAAPPRRDRRASVARSSSGRRASRSSGKLTGRDVGRPPRGNDRHQRPGARARGLGLSRPRRGAGRAMPSRWRLLRCGAMDATRPRRRGASDDEFDDGGRRRAPSSRSRSPACRCTPTSASPRPSARSGSGS